MKCKKKSKHCTCHLIFQAKGDNFICSGVNTKPTKYEKDIIKLCLNGAFCKRELEMTKGEAAFIIGVLATSLGQAHDEE